MAAELALPIYKPESAVGKKLQVGNAMNQKVVDMVESTDLYEAKDFDGLRQRMDRDGYLMIRGVIPREKAIGARAALLKNLQKRGAIEKGTPFLDGVIAKDPTTGKPFEGWTVDAESGGTVGSRDEEYNSWKQIGNGKALVGVYHGEEVRNLYAQMFGDGFRPQTGYTWLRMKGKGEMTIEHADYYYFKRTHTLFSDNRETPFNEKKVNWVCSACSSAESEDDLVCCDICDAVYHLGCLKPALKAAPEGEWHCSACADGVLPVYTCWMALGNVKYENGTLAMLPGTHKLTGYDLAAANEQTPLGYKHMKNVPAWHTAEMTPGDIVLFSIKTIHAATKNTGKTFRVSLDTRVVARPLCPAKDQRKEEKEAIAESSEQESADEAAPEKGTLGKRTRGAKKATGASALKKNRRHVVEQAQTVAA